MISQWYAELHYSAPVYNPESGEFNINLLDSEHNIRDKHYQYAKEITRYIKKESLDLALIDPKTRGFFILNNEAGPFKSAYAQNLSNVAAAID